MELIDPATGQALPADAIQRVLFVATSVHVYNIPPLASTKGYNAATWTADPQRQIFTARARVIETAFEQQGGSEKLKVNVILEDPATGQLFAAAPYTAPAVVEPVLDSSRFFALRVQDGQGHKATLGIGFEERSEAFDFSVALQEARKSLGLDGGADQGSNPSEARSEEKRDYSLKAGETITVNLPGTKFGRKAQPQEPSPPSGASLSSFSLPPPPSTSGSRGSSLLPPPPSASDVRAQQKSSKDSAKEMGFDDGQFDEFA